MARDRTDVHELPTPRSISRTGYRVHVWCKACRRAKDADLAALVDAGKGDVPLVRPRWRCRNCGSRLTEFVVGGSHIRAMNAGRCSEPPMIAVRYTYKNGAL
jgi:hypothetical protein